MQVEKEAVPAFDVPLTLPEIRILYRVSGGVLASWMQTANPTQVQLRRQAELRDANVTLGDWLVESGVRG